MTTPQHPEGRRREAVKKCKANCWHVASASNSFKYPCSRNPWKDGYCRQHHPKEKELRHKARMKAFEEKQKRADAWRIRHICPYCNGTGQSEMERP